MATHSSILAWEMPRTEEPDGPHSMGPIRVGLNPATTNRSISKDHTRVCVCVCVCVSVCLSVCLPVVRLLSQEGRVLGGRRGDKGGASVGQRGGAEALRSTAPPWLPVGLGSGQVPGKLGAQDSLRLGPQEVQRPPGRGDREAAGPEDRHLRGRAALSSERDGGGGGRRRSASAAGSGVAGGGRAPRPPHPSAHPPGPARTHARPPGHWGVLEAHRAPGPGQAVAGLVLAVFGGRAGVSRLECGRGSCGSSTARPPEERGGPLARPAGQSEREAKRKALRAPRGGRVRLRPYRPEGARSRLISEAKQGRACSVSWMGDHLGIPGAGGFFAYQKRSFSPRPASQFLDPHPPRPPATPAAPAPPGAGGVSGWPGPRLPLQTWVASPRPASPSAFAFGFQETRRPAVPSPSGAPLACLRQSRGLHRLQPEPQPPPHPQPRRRSRMRMRARAQIDVPKRGI